MTELDLEVQYAVESEGVPAESRFREWVEVALEGRVEKAALTIRIVDAAESAELNGSYRDKPYPTNVLSFPLDMPAEADIPYLGDLAICAAVVAREAQEQGKPPEAHWAHMVVHGVLHLLGYDHLSEAEAEEMEALEVTLLSRMGYPDPYQSTH